MRLLPALPALLLALAALVLTPAAVSARPVKDASGSVKTETLSAANAQSQTVSYTVSAGSDRLLMVRVNYDSEAADTSGTTVTYGGVSLTLLDEQLHASDVSQAVTIWYLIAPTVGTANVVIDLSGTTQFAHCLSVIDAWTNTHQTSPFGPTAEASETSGSFAGASVDVTSVNDDLVVDIVGTFYSGGLLTLTQGASQTVDAKEENNAIISTGTSRENAVGVSTTMSWSFSSNVTSYRIIGVAMKSPDAVGTGALTLRGVGN